MAPSTSAFANSFTSLGNMNIITNRFTVKTKKVNKLYQGTAAKMAYLARILQMYFGEFSTVVQGMLAAL